MWDHTEHVIDEQKARRSSIDIQLAKSLIKMSDVHIEAIRMLELNETTASTIMTMHYEALREIVEAIAATKGYKIYSHEALTYFLKDLGEDITASKFDRFRKIRNSINYYGKQVDIDSTEKNIKEIERMIRELKQKFFSGDSQKIPKSDEEWKKKLTTEQYAILRKKSTELPFTGKYVHNKEKGMYYCAGCGNELFSSDTKFDSGSGWPSFTESANRENVELIKDRSRGMIRTEVVCKKCGGHLGHLFDDGPKPTCQRFCVNSTALNFKKK